MTSFTSNSVEWRFWGRRPEAIKRSFGGEHPTIPRRGRTQPMAGLCTRTCWHTGQTAMYFPATSPRQRPKD